MKRHSAKMIAIFISFSIVVILTGCMTLGPEFKKIETFPDNKAIVYIYRPDSFIGGGVAYDVKVGETPIITLYNGGYYPYFSEPGEIEFWAKTEAKSSVTIDIKPNTSYYIKGTVGVGFLVGRPHLIVVAPEVAKNEIEKCKLIPEKK
jgi:hypothetical protein